MFVGLSSPTRAQAQASAADLAGVNLSMHANLAFDYFAARSLDAEEKLLQDTVVQYQNALDLNDALYREDSSPKCWFRKQKPNWKQPALKRSTSVWRGHNLSMPSPS